MRLQRACPKPGIPAATTAIIVFTFFSLIQASLLQTKQLLTGWKSVKLDLAKGNRDGYLFVPPSYSASKPSPLLVLLHGAGKNAAAGVSEVLSAADAKLLAEQRTLLLVPQSRGPTWDLIYSGSYGPDLQYISHALAAVQQRQYKVDSSRIALAGFSDGATYALSLGLVSSSPWSSVVALSPGGFVPARQAGVKKVFVSHGTNDQLFPIDQTSRRIVPQLKQLLPGRELHYVEFSGGHEVPDAVSKQALEWWLKGTPVTNAKYSQKGR